MRFTFKLVNRVKQTTLPNVWRPSSSQPEAWWEGEFWLFLSHREPFLPACLPTGTWAFFCLQTHAETSVLPGSPAWQPSDQHYLTGSPGTSSCWLTLHNLGLVSLCSSTSQFLTITSLQTHIHCTHKHTPIRLILMEEMIQTSAIIYSFKAPSLHILHVIYL